MREHPLIQVMRSVPINLAARHAVNQGSCLSHDSDLTKEEIIHIAARLVRKLKLLKIVLSIDTKAKHRNFISAVNGRGGSGFGRIKKNPRSASEYVRCGLEIQRMEVRLHDIKVHTASKNKSVTS